MRMDDYSSDHRRWSSRKLVKELRDKANLTSFSTPTCGLLPNDPAVDADHIRHATKLYRDTWMNPIINELERRLVKPPRIKS